MSKVPILRAAVPLARSSLSITVDEKTKGCVQSIHGCASHATAGLLSECDPNYKLTSASSSTDLIDRMPSAASGPKRRR